MDTCVRHFQEATGKSPVPKLVLPALTPEEVLLLPECTFHQEHPLSPETWQGLGSVPSDEPLFEGKFHSNP